MIKKPCTTQYSFALTDEQIMANLDHLKLVDYTRFLKTIVLGKQIQQLAKLGDRVQSLQLRMDSLNWLMEMSLTSLL